MSSVSTTGPRAGPTVKLIVWVMPSQRTPAPAYMAQSFNGLFPRSFATKHLLNEGYSSQQAQQCFRYARSSALGATDTFYSWACGTASDDILVLATVTDGSAPTPDAETTGINDILRSITQGSRPTTAANPPTVPGGNSSPLSTTAIALIAVGAAVVLLIALLFGYCCCWKTLYKRHKRNKEIVHQTTPPQFTYQETVTNGARSEIIPSWNSGTPLGANPNVPPSVVPSDYSSVTASEMPRPMATLHEQHSGYGYRSY
jgi:hypothetical protein